MFSFYFLQGGINSMLYYAANCYANLNQYSLEILVCQIDVRTFFDKIKLLKLPETSIDPLSELIVSDQAKSSDIRIF